MDHDKRKAFDYDIVKESDLNGGRILNGTQIIGGNRRLNGFDLQKIKDIICFSHLRWNFVFQRPQHLLSRWAGEARVFYIEEPVQGDFESNFLKTVYSNAKQGVTVITPHVMSSLGEEEINLFVRESLRQIVKWYKINDYMLWYLTPMAVEFTGELQPKITVYDSMDELSCFKGAHPNMLRNEERLFRMADAVFTGGHNLYEYKKHRHHNIYPFPSSIDQKHFESGLGRPDPADQAKTEHPRVGFFGVIDERFDIDLLDGLSLAMPEVQFIIIGPVVKIDPASLPKHSNIHYLGQKSYAELPLYLAHWDVAFLPFAKNESTRFISPTKTPEYLSALKPVVSTSIRDVVVPYGEMGLVEIADTVEAFSSAIMKVINRKNKQDWEKRVKEHLKGNSWDLTWTKMKEVIYKTLAEKEDDINEIFVNSGTGTTKGTIV